GAEAPARRAAGREGRMIGEYVKHLAREKQLDEVIAGYVQAAEAGRAPPRGELLARHPDPADDLAAFFADQAEVLRLVAPLRAAGPAPPAAPTPPPRPPPT